VLTIVTSAANGIAIGSSPGVKFSANSFQDRDPMKPLQNVVASKTAKFASITKDDPAYKHALDAHELAAAMKLVGTEGSFRGTVDQFFEERDGDLVVFDFDHNYRTALTAVLRNADFPKFPVVRELKGKEIVVSGKFVDYHGKAQIELTDPKQIKLVN
jgi:hypothetical protein